MIISKILERTVKRRRRKGGKNTKKENLGKRRKRRRSQSTARNHNYIRLHGSCTIVGRLKRSERKTLVQ